MSTTTTYTVRGMTCDHCVRSVREEVTAIAGVDDVDIDLTTGRLDVHTDAPVDSAAVRAAVEEAGYELAEVAP